MSRTVLYLGVLTGLVLVIGEYLGGQQGLYSAFLFAGLMNFVMYFWSDKIVLAMYRATPIAADQYPELHEIVERLAKKANIPTPKIYMTSLEAPNAFATGRDANHAAIAVTAGLLPLLDSDELEGVLAHELSHVLNRDMLVATVAATLAGALSMLARMAFWYGPSGDRDRDRGGGGGSLFMLILAPLAASLVQLAISRQREFGADASGARLLGDGRALASALQKIDAASKQLQLLPSPAQQATAHLFIVNPFHAGFLLRLFSTPPPTDERVRRLLA